MARQSHSLTRRGIAALILAVLVAFFITKIRVNEHLSAEYPISAAAPNKPLDVEDVLSPQPRVEHADLPLHENDPRKAARDNAVLSPKLSNRVLIDDPTVKALFTKYSGKGHELKCILDNPQIEESKWTNYDSLDSWGWGVTETPVNSQDLNKQLTGLENRVGDLSDGVEMDWSHNQNTDHDVGSPAVDTEFLATFADYTNNYFVNQGVIESKANYGPAYRAATGGTSVKKWPEGAPFPELRQWSDVIGLTWIHLTNDQQSKNLRWIFRRQVRNDDGQDIIGYVCEQENRGQAKGGDASGAKWQAPKWPGVQFTPNDVDSFNGLLGTPNASGIVWLLAQHKAAMGQKTIKSITVWYDEQVGAYAPSMLFEIGDA